MTTLESVYKNYTRICIQWLHYNLYTRTTLEYVCKKIILIEESLTFKRYNEVEDDDNGYLHYIVQNYIKSESRQYKMSISDSDHILEAAEDLIPRRTTTYHESDTVLISLSNIYIRT